MIRQRQEAQNQEATGTSRRSSAARELYLTKYYFYQEASLKTSDYDSVLDNYDDYDDADDDCDGDGFDRADVENYHLKQQQQQQRQVKLSCVSRLSEPRYADNDPLAPLQLELAQPARQHRNIRQPGSPAPQPAPLTATRNQPRVAPSNSPNQSDNSSLISQSTTTVSPSSPSENCKLTTKPQQGQLQCQQHQSGLPASSCDLKGCSIHQISLAKSPAITGEVSRVDATKTCASSKPFEQRQHFHHQHPGNLSHFHNGYRSLQERFDLQRKNSIQDCELIANANQEKRPSIEEQLKRLLEIDSTDSDKQQTENNNQETEESRYSRFSDRKTLRSTTSYHSTSEMKKNSPGGDAANPLEQPARDSQNRGYRKPRSPNDRLMIFMLASRSTSTNSAVERNARILKWLNNCRDAS